MTHGLLLALQVQVSKCCLASERLFSLMNAMARKQGSHADITGPKVRAAALRLFARDGYAAVSMRQIATEVGVQVGTLYNYTPDKQSLLAGLMEDHMRVLLADWAVSERPTDPLGQLACFTRFHIRYHVARPDQVFIAYMELRNLTAENFARVQALRNQYEEIVVDILSAGRDCGAFRLSDPRIAAMALIAMLTGPSTWFRGDGRLQMAEIEDIYWEMVRGAVCVPAGDA